jgi:hypothetical protein
LLGAVTSASSSSSPTRRPVIRLLLGHTACGHASHALLLASLLRVHGRIEILLPFTWAAIEFVAYRTLLRCHLLDSPPHPRARWPNCKCDFQGSPSLLLCLMFTIRHLKARVAAFSQYPGAYDRIYILLTKWNRTHWLTCPRVVKWHYERAQRQTPLLSWHELH